MTFPASERRTARPMPTTHRSLATLGFPRIRWLHVTLLPALLSAGVWAAGDALVKTWAWFLNRGIELLGLNGIVRALPTHRLYWDSPAIVLVDIPAAAPSGEQLIAGALIAAALLLLSFIVDVERVPTRYMVRALTLCHSSALVFFGLFSARLPYSLNDHVAASLTMAWMFMLLIPWMHAASFYVFGFGLWRKLALTLLTLAHLVLFVPAQYLFHIAAVQTYSLLQLPLLYLLAGVLLDVVVFISLYAWAMSWQTVEDAGTER